MIDTYAILSGTGEGQYTDTILTRDLLPSAIEQLMPMEAAAPSTLVPKEYNKVLQVLECNRTISILAARLGYIARNIRQDYKQYASDLPPTTLIQVEIMRWQGQILELQDALRQCRLQIRACQASSYLDEDLPDRARSVFEHVSELSLNFNEFMSKLVIPFTVDSKFS